MKKRLRKKLAKQRMYDWWYKRGPANVVKDETYWAEAKAEHEELKRLLRLHNERMKVRMAKRLFDESNNEKEG